MQQRTGRTRIENPRPLILSLTDSDQSHSKKHLTGQNDHISAECICRGLIEWMINFSELAITFEVVTFEAL